MSEFLSTLTGSFSQPAGDNPTVAMVEASFRATGLEARYINCDVAPEHLGDAVRGAVAQGWVGFNCSLPHKVAVIDHLDELADSARIIGAVNCVTITGGRLVGENTDGKGFVEALRPVRDPRGARVVVVGAGGAARAIAVELALAGAEHITIVNRSRERGELLADLIAESTHAAAEFVQADGEYSVPPASGIVINATSIGMFPNVTARVPIDTNSLEPRMLVADVIPNPPLTPFLRAAESRGCITIDGQGMLVNQAAVALELWTGEGGDKQAMHEELRRLFPGEVDQAGGHPTD